MTYPLGIAFGRWSLYGSWFVHFEKCVLFDCASVAGSRLLASEGIIQYQMSEIRSIS